MTKESSTVGSHLSVAMTTTETDESTTGGDTVTSSSSREGTFYFQCAVLVIGIVGIAANALVIYAMVASKQHKKHLLIFNQNVFDLCSCLFLVIVYTLKLCNVYLTGTFGHWLCVVLLSENSIWCSMNGSVINLMSVTIERYIRVVHHTRSHKLLRNWVVYSAVAFAWISTVVYCVALVFSTTAALIDGACYARLVWRSRLAAAVYSMWYFMSFFGIVVFTIIFCYGRILVVIRRQASVMAGHSGPGPTPAQTQSHQIQSNVVKTMIFVSIFYVITWMPINVYYMIRLRVCVLLTCSCFYCSYFLCPIVCYVS